MTYYYMTFFLINNLRVYIFNAFLFSKTIESRNALGFFIFEKTKILHKTEENVKI